MTTNPTTSLAPSSEPACVGSDPLTCGCASVDEADYRGTISETADGVACDIWPGYLGEIWLDAGLEDNNYCRNPENDDRAFCWTIDGEIEYCNIPFCFPPPMHCSPSNSASNSLNDESQAACSYFNCAAGSDDVSNVPVPLRLKDIKGSCQCPYEIWDCKFGSRDCFYDAVRKSAFDCCTNESGITNSRVASCECFVKPECEAGDHAQCLEGAYDCCDKDQGCICEYATKACHFALGNEVLEDLSGFEKYCGYAADVCCPEEIGGAESCRCDFADSLCTNYPNSKGGTCTLASTACCDLNDPHCKCDLFSHSVDSLGTTMWIRGNAKLVLPLVIFYQVLMWSCNHSKKFTAKRTEVIGAQIMVG